MAKKQKKILLFIVEGPTDEISLGLILSKLFDNEDVKFKVVRGDITSDRGSNSQNIIKKVLEKCFETEHLENSKLYVSITLTNPDNIHKINKEYKSSAIISRSDTNFHFASLISLVE